MDVSQPLTAESWRWLFHPGQHFDPAAEEDALARARQGIEQYRKQDVELVLTYRDGSPVVNLGVEIVQKRHAFLFGEQLWALDRMHRFGEHENDRAFYLKMHFANLVNAANALCYWTEHPRNDGPKVEDIQGRAVTEHFEYCVDWAASQGLMVKGHPLFWSIDKCVPGWVKRYDYDTQMKFAEVRVRNLVARFKGRITYWDAVNEALWEATFRNLASRNWPHLEPIPAIADMIAPVLTWARQEDPDACYTINDYGLEEAFFDSPPTAQDGMLVTAALQRRRYLELAEELKRRKTPPSALGLQGHIGKSWTTLSHQMAIYDELSQSGLGLHVTEFSAETGRLSERQGLSASQVDEVLARYTCDQLTLAFGHPNVQAFFFWGMLEQAIRWGEHSSHELKPMYHQLHDLIHREWNTRLTAGTDSQGRMRFRGFLGDYVCRLQLSQDMPLGLSFSVSRQSPGPVFLSLPFSL